MREKIKEQIVALLKGAEAAHSEYEKELGHEDDNWAEWYAEYIVEKLKETGMI